MRDAIERLRDTFASRTSAHTSMRGRACESAGWSEVENEELDATARRLVGALPADDLAAIVAEWLDAQITI